MKGPRQELWAELSEPPEGDTQTSPARKSLWPQVPEERGGGRHVLGPSPEGPLVECEISKDGRPLGNRRKGAVS